MGGRLDKRRRPSAVSPIVGSIGSRSNMSPSSRLPTQSSQSPPPQQIRGHVANNNDASLRNSVPPPPLTPALGAPPPPYWTGKNWGNFIYCLFICVLYGVLLGCVFNWGN